MARKRWYSWTGLDEQRAIGERALAGESPRLLAQEFGVTARTIRRIRAEAYAARRRVAHSPHRLSYEDRVRIEIGISQGERDSEIARAIGRDRSTVGREILRGCGERRWLYRARAAQRRADRRCARPKERKLAGCARLREAVEVGLEAGWSPQQISAWLRVEFPDDEEMRISHETIYLSLFVQARGELRTQLTTQLRTGRTRRKPQGQHKAQGRIAEMINISERPAEVEDRAVPGHWEGDLIIGAGNRSAVATLVERQTRYVLLAYLGNDRTSEHVTRVLAERIRALPVQLFRSLTWDQGAEMSAHRQFTTETGVTVYFCDPRSPWQRGSNENTNGLLRQYLPKSTDLAVHDQAALDQIAVQLNGRPRQTLGWATPAQKMNALLGTPLSDPGIRPLSGSSSTDGRSTD